MATFVVSALWHGVYPGFYFSFVTLALFNIVSQASTRLLRPCFVTYDSAGVERPRPYWKSAYDVLTWVTTQGAFYYSANPFKQMSFANVVASWSAVYWFFHVGAAAVMLLYVLFGGLLKRFHTRRPRTETVQPDSKVKDE